MRMPEPRPLGETSLRAIVRAIRSAEPVPAPQSRERAGRSGFPPPRSLAGCRSDRSGIPPGSESLRWREPGSRRRRALESRRWPRSKPRAGAPPRPLRPQFEDRRVSAAKEKSARSRAVRDYGASWVSAQASRRGRHSRRWRSERTSGQGGEAMATMRSRRVLSGKSAQARQAEARGRQPVDESRRYGRPNPGAP